MDTLRTIERAACATLWRMPASLSALAIVAVSLSGMAALAGAIVATIATLQAL